MPGRLVREIRIVYEMTHVPDDPEALFDAMFDLRRQAEENRHRVLQWEMAPRVHHALVRHLLNSPQCHPLDTLLGAPVEHVHEEGTGVVAVVHDERTAMEDA